MRNVLWLLGMFAFGCAPSPPPNPDDYKARHRPDDRMAVIGFGPAPSASYESPYKGKAIVPVSGGQIMISDDEMDVFWDLGEAASHCGVKEYHVREYSDASEMWLPMPKDVSKTMSCIEARVYMDFSVHYKNFSELGLR